jgi:hypothetical protein
MQLQTVLCYRYTYDTIFNMIFKMKVKLYIAWRSPPPKLKIMVAHLLE